MNLIYETNPLLRVVTKPWDFSDINLDPEQYSKEMIRLMLLYDGIGLAATQIGSDYSVFVMGNIHSQRAYFNPKIISYGVEKVVMEEGCLSFPDLYLKISRSSMIEVEYMSDKRILHREQLEGVWARCFQHELDHLHGKTFDTHASKLVLSMARKRRAKKRMVR